MPESHIDQLTAADLPLRLGRYELQSILGEGGMARVFRAELRGPAGFRKAVALKVIKVEAGQSVSTQQVLSLIKEACLGGRLKHPNLVDVYELGEVGKQLFISMELVEGETLHHLLRSKDPIPPAVMMEIAVSMTAGLARAHGQVSEASSTGMVHRDLKPSNILLSVDGEVKISDFGVAISREEARDAFPASIGGTVSYMSPEQMKGEALDGRSDLFSLGLVIAEMVLGYKPIGDDVRKQQLAGLPLRSPLLTRNQFSALNDVISGIGELLLRCLEPEKENRVPNAAQLLEELQQLQEQVGYTPRLRTWFSQRNKSAKKSAVPVREPAKGGARSPLMDDTTAILPPTKALGNIIPSLDQFVGRESELAQLAKCFETGARLVTVKGTGGAGKTRFARRFAHRHREELAGGAWFIDLTEARTPKGLLHATAMALEVPLGGEDFDGMVTKVGHAISGRGPVLLVLDNFEQVVQHASVTVGPWLKMAPEASFLVTSRERLRLEGEQVFALEPLPEADGVALFELRARAAGASLGEDPQTRTAITRIVTALDGLPLAIELAAARAVLLSPTQLLERLSERFELLRGGRRGDTDRQSSLVGLIDWSWDLLEPWEQAALAQLSVFRDGFFMEAAEAVLDLSAWRDAP